MDSVARLGGDEFVVLLPGVDNAGRRGALSQAVIADGDQRAIATRARHGARVRRASAYRSRPKRPRHDAHPDSLLHTADTAMYYAKSLGGSRTELFDARHASAARTAQTAWSVADPRRRIDEDASSSTSSRSSSSRPAASSRGTAAAHGDRGGELIPPLAFLPTAEKCGLIGEIDSGSSPKRPRSPLAADGRRQPLRNVHGGSRCARPHRTRAPYHGTDPGKLVF